MPAATFKTILIATATLSIISCNNDSKSKSEIKEMMLEEIKSDTPPPPPKTEPPKVEIKEAEKKCFANEGLKYKTTVEFKMGETDFTGTVTSEELESGKKVTADFTGVISGKKMIVKFKGTPPVVGAASEWTDKPWTIEKVEGKSQLKEKLHIVFNAKNYDTNKWEDTDYKFVLVDCK
jgi:hypothetical protein